MASNTDIEIHWFDAWDDLCDIIGDRADIPCQLPDWSVIDAESCRGWLQDSAYDGYHVRVEVGWVGHLRGAIVHRCREVET